MTYNVLSGTLSLYITTIIVCFLDLPFHLSFYAQDGLNLFWFLNHFD